MTKDLFFYYPCDPLTVYSAYLRTANEQFSKQCREDIRGVVFSFGLDYSFKYNMNGGACTIHFLPYQGGTAVAIRYTVVQLFGARISRHSTDITTYADNLLGVKNQPATLNISMFTSYEASFKGQNAPAQPASAPVQNAAENQNAAAVCSSCGKPLTAGAKFCVSCGKPVLQNALSVCPNCGRPCGESGNFCVGCGAKLR